FAPPASSLSIKAVYAAVPKHLLQRSTSGPKCLFYVGRDVLLSICFYLLAIHINDSLVPTLDVIGMYNGGRAEYAREWVMWVTYWLWQSLETELTHYLRIGHECGHDALSPNSRVNAALCMVLHTFILTLYWAWRATQRSHHSSTNNLHRDEMYHAQTREEYGLP
ncbi:hypothetical protein FOMPIDRAFT_22924, partial [Fomitopsis schrenkii]